MSAAPLSVSQLTAIIKGALLSQPELEDVLVEGEISNLSNPSSGHLYFTLKDARSSISCVCFRSNARQVPFRPENGMKVVLHGHLDVYEQQGRYQLYVQRIDPAGLGALALAVAQTRRRLAAEGLFAESRKRPLPRLPRRVVVVTSLAAAALRDVCQVIGRRAPSVDIVVVPATVQGDDAVPSLVHALEHADLVADADVVLLVRGGGSLEDLMAFNDELVARAVARCRLPVVTGVGHETDVTIVDEVADRRAPTPSAAAELAVPSAAQLAADIAARRLALGSALQRTSGAAQERLDRCRVQLARRSPLRRVAMAHQDLDARRHRLVAGISGRVGLNHSHLREARARLAGQTPQRRIASLRVELENRSGRLRAGLLARVGGLRNGLAHTVRRFTAADPGRRVAQQRHRLALAQARLVHSGERLLDAAGRDLRERRGRLDALSPVRVLERGYSITTVAGVAVTSAAGLGPGTRLVTRLADGEVSSEVVAEGDERMYDDGHHTRTKHERR